jgi:predicted PurR-regulated permease PerM
MKIEWKTCLRLGVSIFLLYLCINYWSLAAYLLMLFLGAAKPLLIGCVIAYLLNILMSFYEEHYFPKKTAKLVVNSRRIVCMLAAMLTLVGIVLLVIRLVIPELLACIQLLASEVPETLEHILKNRSVAEFLPKDVLASLKSFNWQERGNGSFLLFFRIDYGVVCLYFFDLCPAWKGQAEGSVYKINENLYQRKLESENILCPWNFK